MRLRAATSDSNVNIWSGALSFYFVAIISTCILTQFLTKYGCGANFCLNSSRHIFALSFKIFVYSEALKMNENFPVVFYKKGVLRNLAKSTGKRLRRSLFLDKVARLRHATSLKRGSNTGVFQ